MSAISRSADGLPLGFDPARYLALNPDVAAAGADPVAHWLAHGRVEGRFWQAEPLPADFDPALYLALNPDVAAAGVDPALHFRTFGCREGRFHRTAARARRDPLVVFVHVGKTAGSSLNEVLFRTLGPGIRHAETLVPAPWALSQLVPQSGWISGHLSPPRLLSMLDGVTDRPLRLFTLVRAPVDQVASAYNWLLVLHRQKPDILASQEAGVRAAAAEVVAAGNASPARVIGILERHADVFLNTQARTVLGEGAQDMPLAEMRRGLQRYDSIRLQDEIGRLAAEMTGRSDLIVPRENASPYLIDKAVFRSPEVLDFLASANAADARLVAAVRDRVAQPAVPATAG